MLRATPDNVSRCAAVNCDAVVQVAPIALEADSAAPRNIKGKNRWQPIETLVERNLVTSWEVSASNLDA